MATGRIRRTGSNGTPRADGGQKSAVTIVRSCGHEETLEVFGGPTGTRAAQYIASQEQRPCRACWIEERRREEVAADAEAVAAGRRCELEGTERQLPWAIGLRQRRATEFEAARQDAVITARRLMTDGLIDRQRATDSINAFTATVKAILMGEVDGESETQDGEVFETSSAEARWWIDQRTLDVRDLISDLMPDRDWTVAGWAALFFEGDSPPAAEPAEPVDDTDLDPTVI